MGQSEFTRHEEVTARLKARSEDVFAFLDDHHSLAAHMGAGSSPMMGGGSMTLDLDAGGGQEVGSHIRMSGSAFGFRIDVDEVVTQRDPPHAKSWRTVDARLVVIGDYSMGFVTTSAAAESLLTVWIDYALPRRNKWLGILGGRLYARWCVRQMRDAASARFSASR